MDREGSSVDHLIVDTGGQVLASSFDLKAGQYLEDIRFLINRVNPVIEQVEERGTSFCFGPSGIGLVSMFARERELGKRDVVINHTFLISQSTYYSLRGNPFRLFKSSEGSELVERGQIEPLIVVRPRPPHNRQGEALGRRPIAKMILNAYMSAYVHNSPVCILIDETTSLMNAILTLVPLPFRMVPFTTFASKYDSIFRFVLTTPKHLSSFRNKAEILDLSSITKDPETSFVKEGSHDTLPGSLTDLLLDIAENGPQILDECDRVYSSAGLKNLDLQEVCVNFLRTSLHNVAPFRNHKWIEASLTNLEKSVIRTFPMGMTVVCQLTGEYPNSLSIVDLLRNLETTLEPAAFSLAVNSGLVSLANQGQMVELYKVLNYVRNSGRSIVAPERIIKELLQFRMGSKESMKIAEAVKLLLDYSPKLDSKTANDLLKWMEGRSEGSIGIEKKELLRTAFDRIPAVREQIYKQSPDAFMKLVSDKDTIINSDINRRDKIMSLQALLGRSSESDPRGPLFVALAQQIEGIGAKDLIVPEVYHSIRLLPFQLQDEVILSCLTRRKEYVNETHESGYVRMLRDLVNSEIYQGSDPKVSEELAQYSIEVFSAAITRQTYDDSERAKEILEIVSTTSEVNRQRMWNSKKFRNSLTSWVQEYWGEVHVTGERVDDILSCVSRAFKNDISEIYDRIERMSTGERIESIRKSLRDTLQRVIEEAAKQLVLTVSNDLSPAIRAILSNSRRSQ